MFTYQILTKKFINNKLDKDTYSIVEKYSLFYNDYDNINLFKKLENYFNKEKWIFITFNIYISNILKICDKTISNYYHNIVYFNLNEITKTNSQIILKYTQFNEKLTQKIINFYYEDYLDITTNLNIIDILDISNNYLNKILKNDFHLNNDEIKNFKVYIYENLNNIYNLNLYYDYFLDNFNRYNLDIL